MSEKIVTQVAERTGLTEPAVRELFDKGWQFETSIEHPDRWVRVLPFMRPVSGEGDR